MAERDPETGQFVQGASGNPKGRPKGCRNKLGEAFIEALHDDFVESGPGAIQECRQTKPDAYLKVIASLLPREMNLNVSPHDDMTDDELRERARELAAALAPLLAQGDGVDPAGAETATRH